MNSQSSSKGLPGLVYMGQSSLMKAQDPVPEQKIREAEFQQRLKVLAQCMTAYGGIGIAAPQIGWNARVFCIGISSESARYPGAEPIPFQVWINPEIVAKEGQNWAWEGCLSVPGMRGWVQRPAEITARGLDAGGRSMKQQITGFAARVFQHELDHLDGILFPMRITEPRLLVPEASMAEQADWPPDWPSAGAAVTGPGELSARA